MRRLITTTRSGAFASWLLTDEMTQGILRDFAGNARSWSWTPCWSRAYRSRHGSRVSQRLHPSRRRQHSLPRCAAASTICFGLSRTKRTSAPMPLQLTAVLRTRCSPVTSSWAPDPLVHTEIHPARRQAALIAKFPCHTASASKVHGVFSPSHASHCCPGPLPRSL